MFPGVYLKRNPFKCLLGLLRISELNIP